MKSTTTKFCIVLQVDSNNLQITDRLTANYGACVEILAGFELIGLPKLINTLAFQNKLWKFIEKLLNHWKIKCSG